MIGGKTGRALHPRYIELDKFDGQITVYAREEIHTEETYCI